MADFDANPDKPVQRTRANRFDRADFLARRPTEPQTVARLEAVGANAEPSLRSASPAADAPQPSDSLIRASTEEAQTTADHLEELGWSKASIQKILGGPEQPNDTFLAGRISTAQTAGYLRSLGWSVSDIARLLGADEQSHQTAESLFRQHAANSSEAQEALRTAFSQAGAQRVKPDPDLLAGLDVSHLSPESPQDLDRLITQFAALPDVQKQRFLLLLDSQKPKKKSSAPNKGSGDANENAASPGDALPVVKSGLDLLNTALKGLLGSLGGTKKGTDGSKEPVKNKPAFEELPSMEDDNDNDNDNDNEDEDEDEDDWIPESSASEPESLPDPDDTSIESDSESAPD